ncbi:MAG: ComEC/Rec2 family competence protein, partial [Ruminococcus sp.]|nr:ComEC/Rec2 family competence protein [Ruminococcus sp.]
NHLDDNAQSLASAVLLGEKNALEPDVRDAFSDTGMSYLVVVSGMHLAIITMLLKKLLKPRFGAKGVLRMILITAFVLLFAAVTGFTPSVVRAAVMMLFIVAAPLFRRESDSVNALGAAALVLTLPNPYVVGNVGLLLSFAATLGILLWADTILRSCTAVLHLSLQPRREKTRVGRAADLCKRAAALPIGLFAVSLSATLWTIPLAMVFFGRITPATVLISFVAYPLTFLLLLLSLLLVLTAWSPLVHVLAPLINGIAQLLTDAVQRSTELPFTSVKTDSPFWYVWMIVTVLLAVIGVIIRSKKNYIIFSVAVSVLTLSIGASLTVLLC